MHPVLMDVTRKVLWKHYGWVFLIFALLAIGEAVWSYWFAARNNSHGIRLAKVMITLSAVVLTLLVVGATFNSIIALMEMWGG